MKSKKEICSNCGRPHPFALPCQTNTKEINWKYGGKRIYLVGSWSQWQKMIPMKPSEQNPYIFTAYVNLAAGIYQFKFLVDGQWKFDPNSLYTTNSFGSQNNILEVFPAAGETQNDEIENEDIPIQDFSFDYKEGVKVKIFTDINSKTCNLIGSWDSWKSEIPMKLIENQAKNVKEFALYIILQPGRDEYKFIVDHVWMHDPHKISIQNGYGGFNNVIQINKKKESTELIAGQRKFSQLNFDLDKLKWEQNFAEEINFSGIQGHTMNIIGDIIYIFGGFYHMRFLDTLYCVNSNNLEIVLPEVGGKIPEKRAYHQSCVLGDFLIIYGGINQNQVLNDYFILDTVNFKWNLLQPTGKIPPKMERCSLTKVSEELLILFGGYNCTDDLEIEVNYNDVYGLNLEDMVWNKLNISEDYPEERNTHSAICYKKNLIIFGGLKRIGSQGKVYNDLWKINFATPNNLKWENITDYQGQAPEPRFAHSAELIQKYMIIYGGRSLKPIFFSDLFLYDIEERKWFHN